MATKKNLFLMLALAGLLLIWYLSVFVFDFRQSPAISDAFPKINPLEITSIKIYAPANDKIETYLYKKGENWRVMSRAVDAPVQIDRMQTVFEEIAKLNATSVAAIDSSKWDALEITDSLATRIILYTKQGELLDLLVGDFQYKTPSFKPLNPQVKIETKGVTYVRKRGEERVYSAENFFGPTFNQHSDVWRDQYLLRFELDELKKIVIVDKESNGYEIEIDAAGWHLNNQLISNEKVAQFASSILMLNHKVFADGFKTTKEPELRAIFELKSSDPVFLEVFEDDMGRAIMHSSSNPETYFFDYDELLTDQIFLSKNYFFQK